MQLGKVDPRAVAALTQVPEIARQVRDVAVWIRDSARADAPKVTGALRRSIKVQRVYDKATRRVSYRVGWDKAVAFYGPMVELGTEHSPARPHLRPAADAANNR